MNKILTYIFILISLTSWAQPVPAIEENIPFLVTFGKNADKSWGDDDFVQTFFFLIPENNATPIYIRVFDPDASGQHDEIKQIWNTQTRFSVYGGKGAFSEPDARNVNPVGNFKSGTQLATKIFAADKYDNEWYTFGPFNTNEGELDRMYGGYIFKIVVEGLSGDDGNLYRFFLSTSNESNVSVEGANAFCYEYTFRMHDNPQEVSHIYPFVDSRATSIKQSNFDWDFDGIIKIISRVKAGVKIQTSGENEWGTSEHKVEKEEHNSSLDIQFIKSLNKIARNNVVISIQNQFGESLPFYTIPIGGIPKYIPKIKAQQD